MLRARLPDLLFARCSLDGEIDASSHAEGNLAGVATVFIWLAAVEAYVSCQENGQRNGVVNVERLVFNVVERTPRHLTTSRNTGSPSNEQTSESQEGEKRDLIEYRNATRQTKERHECSRNLLWRARKIILFVFLECSLSSP